MGVQEVKKAGGYKIKREIIEDFAEILRRARLIYSYVEVQNGLSYRCWLLKHALGIIDIAKKYVEGGMNNEI
jgi:hypothetical protein